MTPRQHDLLVFIRDYVREHDGISPTFEEMQRHLGLRSKSGVSRVIGLLERDGHVRRRICAARNVELVATETLASVRVERDGAVSIDIPRRLTLEQRNCVRIALRQAESRLLAPGRSAEVHAIREERR